jgi:dienelactone hydrolase
MTDTTDQEMLEFSAKAYGIELEYRHGSDAYYYDDPETGREEWLPQHKDGQALRLAVKLSMTIHIYQQYNVDWVTTATIPNKKWVMCWHKTRSAEAATRLAIARVAELFGREMK